jgi:hypothetical protein
MDNATTQLPAVASLRAWERLGFPNRHALRAAIAAGELRASRPGRRRIFVLRDDLLGWLRRRAIAPEPRP